MKRKHLVRIAAAITGILLAAGSAVADCPPGSFQIGETATTYKCVETLVIDPKFFVMAWERPFLEGHIDDLRVKRQRYQDQLALLKRFYGDQVVVARDFDQIRRDIYFDNAANAVSLLDASAKLFGEQGVLSPAALKQVQNALNGAKAAVEAAAATVAESESNNRRGHAAEAILALKNLPELSNIPPEQQKAFKMAIDTTYKLHKIPARHLKGDSGDQFWKDIARDADDLLNAGGVLMPRLKAMRAAAHIIDGQIVLWKIRADRNSADEAFSKVLTAQRYYQERVQRTDETLEFYEKRLKTISR